MLYSPNWCERVLFPGFFILGLLISLSQAACSQPSAGRPVLSGQITPGADWKRQVYLVRPNYYRQLLSSYEGTVVDSAELAPDGTFAFTGSSWLTEKGLYVLLSQPKGSRYANELQDAGDSENFICVVLDPRGSVRLRAHADALAHTYELLEGDTDNRLLQQVWNMCGPMFAYEASQQQAEVEEWTPHENTVQKQADAALETFVDTTNAVLPAFAALRLRAPGNDFRDKPEMFIRVQERLQTRLPGHPWHAQLAALLDRAKLPVLIGERMPDFALPNPAGDTLRLDSVLSKLTLVDFWASWCAPCRRENRETLRPLYDAYGERGFKILGVSIDRDRAAWENAIRKDGAVWDHVSDLEGDASPVRSELKFEYIPSNYLLDGEGRLLARNLHGEALRRFVEEYLKAH